MDTIEATQVETVRLHLGCGSNVIRGWTNLDLEPGPGVVRHDLTRPLPFASGCAEFIFSEHFIEHIARPQAHALLRECHRVLRPGGILRLSTPDLRVLVAEYIKQRTTEWMDVGWLPLSPCQMFNEGMRLWGHQFVYDLDELAGLLFECGFREVVKVPWRQSAHGPLQGLECRPYHQEIILEATC